MPDCFGQAPSLYRDKARSITFVHRRPGWMGQSLSILPSKSMQNFATVTMELGVEFAEHHCVAIASATGSEIPSTVRKESSTAGSPAVLEARNAILAGGQADASPTVF